MVVVGDTAAGGWATAAASGAAGDVLGLIFLAGFTDGCWGWRVSPSARFAPRLSCMSWSPMGCAGVDGGAGAGVAGASAAGWLWASTPGGRVDWAIFWCLYSVHTTSRRFPLH